MPHSKNILVTINFGMSREKITKETFSQQGMFLSNAKFEQNNSFELEFIWQTRHMVTIWITGPG